MMGNFSFGDYFKDEAVDYAWEWVTGVLRLEPERLWATVHEGDPALELGEDAVAIEAWKRIGHPGGAHRPARQGQLLAGGRDRPCGQCSEIFYDRGEEYACGDPACGPGHCDRYMEIYNLVFMEYDLQPGNLLVRLPTPNVLSCQTSSASTGWAPYGAWGWSMLQCSTGTTTVRRAFSARCNSASRWVLKSRASTATCLGWPTRRNPHSDL